jgi:hypothetical protein
MKYYSKMSDFDINSAVAQLSLWKKKDCEEIHGDEKRGVVSWADGANWHVFDPCSNPSDAWPIMDERKIGLTFVNGEWRASSVKAGYHEFSDTKAFRAAMIVYLMMKDEDK